MSNEELVAEIQAGTTERMGELWEQIERLVKWKAKRIMTALEGCGSRGIEFEDLCQSGYLAMVAAVESFDPAAGGAFSSWFMFHLKTAFAEAIGFRTQRGRKDPLNNALSLDAPLSDDADSDDLMDVIADPTGQSGMISAENALYKDQLHDAMENALSAIPGQYADALRLRYYEGLTLERAGEIRGVGKERIRAMENKGIRLLRRSKIACYLRPFYDFDFYCCSGFGAFQNSGMSIQERYLILEEEHQEREQRRRQERESSRQMEKIRGEIRDTMERINRETEEEVCKMSPEEKERLLKLYGLTKPEKT